MKAKMYNFIEKIDPELTFCTKISEWVKYLKLKIEYLYFLLKMYIKILVTSFDHFLDQKTNDNPRKTIDFHFI